MDILLHFLGMLGADFTSSGCMFVDKSTRIGNMTNHDYVAF